MTYCVDSVVCDYGVFEVYIDKRGKKHKDLKLICNRRANAFLVAEIMNKDSIGEYGEALDNNDCESCRYKDDFDECEYCIYRRESEIDYET